MSTTNRQALISKSYAFARECEKDFLPKKKKPDQQFFGRRAEENPDERRMMKYEGARNRCQVCHIAKSAAGTCMCDE